MVRWIEGIDPQLSSHILSTILLALFVYAFRALMIHGINRWKIMDEDVPRKTIVFIKTVATLILFIGIMVIWGRELRNFALSFVALAAAVAIASKEMILCFLGGIYKASSGCFSIGDRIEVNHIRGDVLDHNFLTTKLLEIGPGPNLHQLTGRTITIPNSLFLTHPILNEDRDKYLLHTFTVPVTIYDDLERIESALLQAANEACASYVDEAASYLQVQYLKEGIDAPNGEPRISLYFPEAHKVNMVVRVPVPGLRKGRIEQLILRRFFELMPEPTRPVSGIDD